MAVPKGWRSNINVNQGKIGPERRKEILDGIQNKGTFLPRGVLEEDMDQTFLEFVNSDKGFAISIDGTKVPVIFLTIQRWTEFSKTWQHSDKYKNIELPFITVVRKPDIQQGQNQAGLWNIPGNRTYTYYKVPTWDGIRKGVDLYKVPQPTSVDMMYEVRLFTNRMKDLNRFNRIIQRAFQSRQCYIDVNGHPMPLILETIGDESNIDDFENRRFYVQLFEIKLQGYILDEDDYEVVPTLNRTMVVTELVVAKAPNKVIFQPNLEPTVEGNKLTWTFVFEIGPNYEFSFVSQYDAKLTKMVNITNIGNITIKVNNVIVFDGIDGSSWVPRMIHANDVVDIKIYKSNGSVGKFQLLGNA
jgi:hypothetical protein